MRPGETTQVVEPLLVESADTVAVSPQEQTARRSLLAAGTKGLLGLWLGLVSSACGDDDATGSTDGGNGDASAALDAGGGMDTGVANDASGSDAADTLAPQPPDADVEPLNALLTLTYQASAAYGLAKPRIAARPDTDEFAARRPIYLHLADAFEADHDRHVTVLGKAIQRLRGTPITRAAATAGFALPTQLEANPTLTNLVKVLATIERTATVTYNQQLVNLRGSRYLAAVIEGSLAQHFIVLLSLLQQTLDTTLTLTTHKEGPLLPAAFVCSVEGEPGLDEVADYFM